MVRSGLITGGLVLALAGSTTAVAHPPVTPAGSQARQSVPRAIDPATLRRGPDAQVDHLQGGVILTADGRRRIRVRVPHTGDQQALLGRSGQAYVVASKRGDTVRIHRVRRGHAPVEVPHTRLTFYSDSRAGWRLSRDGRWLVTTTFDRGGTGVSVRDLTTGRRVASTYGGAFYQPLDVSDGHLVTFSEDDQGELSVVDWVPPADPRRVAGDATWADVRRNLLFVRSGGGYGPTSLDVPGTPPWTARFQPLDVSPDGRLVVGLQVNRTFDDPAVLQLRRMSDGGLQRSWAFGETITQDNWSISTEHEQTARFESRSRVVLQLTTDRGAVLVRCRVSGPCRRASEWGGDVSTSYERFMW